MTIEEEEEEDDETQEMKRELQNEGMTTTQPRLSFSIAAVMCFFYIKINGLKIANHF